MNGFETAFRQMQTLGVLRDPGATQAYVVEPRCGSDTTHNFFGPRKSTGIENTKASRRRENGFKIGVVGLVFRPSDQNTPIHSATSLVG